MAAVKPFLCIRPEASVASRVAALPYDVYNRAEAKAEVAREPLSFLKVDRAETQFSDEVDTYADCVYEKARELLDGMIADGTFVKEESPCYYIYELTMNDRAQTGIVACSSIDDYAGGIIKKHENTRADKEVDRIRHVDTCDAQTGPIFLAYRARADINAVVEEVKAEKPLYDFTAPDGVRHTVWRIGETDKVKALEEGFSKVPNTYIADGHHRAASAVKVGLKRREENPGYRGDEPYNYFLSVLFPDEQLMIMDYNRVVKDLNGLSEQEFMAKVKDCCEVREVGKEPYRPSRKGEFGMFLNDVWYCLTTKRVPSGDPVADLDVSVLQNTLLEPVLGIGDPRTDKRIDFIGGIRGLSELERRCHTDMKVAFSMYPTSISELFQVADASRLMPPKSTWFEPKLRSGIFIHKLS
ncbi:DUF1015 domain-containing protein [Qiania dongpingensis]|uniref:DUF1015 domain-containing protein n=1 Tax=Qiania dongpingensis TaxID=2763669 RepID=A0A7G9G0H1_9FIRM|nr:DUF1015 family protein [Qiania dongpingensis]QNM04303.1 DUF1015 domain-containing protein [Qiania dongpingensis]